MAVAIFLHADGFTKDQYDAVRALVPFDPATAPGALFHLSAIDDTGIHVTDVWESAEDFQTYLTEHLAPAFAQLGITAQPAFEVIPVHAVENLGISQK